MAVNIQDFKSYLTPPIDEAENLNLFLSAAKSKARAAGIPDYQNNANYDLFIYSLAAMFYDNRGMTFSGAYQATAESNAQKLINSFVLSLRYADEDTSDTEGAL